MTLWSPTVRVCHQVERCNWLVRRFSEDPFGDALIKAGLTEKTLRAWSADPQLFPPSAAPDEKVKASLFGASLGLSNAAVSIRRLTLGVRASDLLEDLDAEECLEKCAVRQPVLSSALLSATESPDWARLGRQSRAGIQWRPTARNEETNVLHSSCISSFAVKSLQSIETLLLLHCRSNTPEPGAVSRQDPCGTPKSQSSSAGRS